MNEEGARYLKFPVPADSKGPAKSFCREITEGILPYDLLEVHVDVIVDLAHVLGGFTQPFSSLHPRRLEIETFFSQQI